MPEVDTVCQLMAKNDTHGSRRTIHGGKRHVMGSGGPHFAKASPRHARLRSDELPSSSRLRRDRSPRQASQGGGPKIRNIILINILPFFCFFV